MARKPVPKGAGKLAKLVGGVRTVIRARVADGSPPKKAPAGSRRVKIRRKSPGGGTAPLLPPLVKDEVSDGNVTTTTLTPEGLAEALREMNLLPGRR